MVEEVYRNCQRLISDFSYASGLILPCLRRVSCLFLTNKHTETADTLNKEENYVELTEQILANQPGARVFFVFIRESYLPFRLDGGCLSILQR